MQVDYGMFFSSTSGSCKFVNKVDDDFAAEKPIHCQPAVPKQWQYLYIQITLHANNIVRLVQYTMQQDFNFLSEHLVCIELLMSRSW